MQVLTYIVMNTGKLSFSTAPILGQRLPVEDIQQMNKVLDEKYKTNEAYLDSIENTLNTIKVEDRNNPILEERKLTTLNAIKDLRNSGNLESAGRNIKSIVANLAQDELFQGAIYSKQLADKADAELDAAYKKNLETGKGGINEEQYKLAKLVNKFQNTKQITRDNEGNIINYFKAESVPNYQDIQEELLKNIKELKPGTIDYTNMESRIIGTNDKDLVNTWHRLINTAKSAGAIDSSIFKGITGEKLMVLAQQVLNNDNIQNYINWMSKAKTIQHLGIFDEYGRPITDEAGNPQFKQITINDINNIYKNKELTLGQDSEGHPALGKWEDKTVKDKNGQLIKSKVFNVDDWYTTNLLSLVDNNNVNQEKFREYYMREQYNAYYNKGTEYSKAFAYGEIIPNHIKDYYLANSLKTNALKELLQDPPTYPVTYDNSANIQINDATSKLPESLNLITEVSPYSGGTGGGSQNTDAYNKANSVKPYDVLFTIDKRNPYRNQQITSAVNDVNSYSSFVRNYLGDDKYKQLISNKQYKGWTKDLEDSYNKWLNGFTTSNGQQIPGIKQTDMYKPTEISYINSKAIKDGMVLQSKVQDGDNTKVSYNFNRVHHGIVLNENGEGLIQKDGTLTQVKPLNTIAKSAEELSTQYGEPFRVGFTNGAFYNKNGVLKPYLRMYKNDNSGGSLLVVSPIEDDNNLSPLIQIGTIGVKGNKMRGEVNGDYLFNVAEFNQLKQMNHPAVAQYKSAPGITIPVPYRDSYGRIKQGQTIAWYDPTDKNGAYKIKNIKTGKIEYVNPAIFDQMYDALSRLGNIDAQRGLTNSGARHTEVDYETKIRSINFLNDNDE